MPLDQTPLTMQRIDPASHIQRTRGLFQIRRIHPGAGLGVTDDQGFNGLGLIDHANLSPGLTVPMHEHRNDEIISYLRSGEMLHRDSDGRSAVVSPTRLMVMNAGASFHHEEAVQGSTPIEMLQIFVRPWAEDLEPAVQFHELDRREADTDWRVLTGPEGSDAPTSVRQSIWLQDRHLETGETVSLPNRPGHDAWLYVFEGAVTLAGETLQKHDAVAITQDAENLQVFAQRASDLVLFHVDPTSAFSRSGTLSG